MSGPFRVLTALLIIAVAPTVMPGASFAEGILWCGNRAFDGVTGCALFGNYPTSAQAQHDGLERCRRQGHVNCRIVATFRNSCYAYAFTNGAAGWGAGGGPDLASAQAAAIAACQIHNPGFSCYAHDAACDTVDEEEVRRAEEERIRKEAEARAEKERQARELAEAERIEREQRARSAEKAAQARALRERALKTDMESCFQGGDISACNRLLSNPDVPVSELGRIERKRAQLTSVRDSSQQPKSDDADTALSTDASYEQLLAACERYDLTACHRISSQPLPVPGLGMADKLDRISLKNMRFNSALQNTRTFHLYLKQCNEKHRVSCEAALAMPGITPDHRATIARMQAALPFYNLDDPKHFLWTLIALPLLGFLGFLVLARRSPANISSHPPDARPLDRLYHIALSRVARMPLPSITNVRAALARLIAPTAQSEGAAPAASPPTLQPDLPRDPETAHSALQLAHAYLSELPDELPSEIINNPSAAATHRSTLALAAKQLAIAHRADPTTNLVIDEGDSAPLTLTQQWLRARMLQLEALTWSATKPRREVQLLTQATEIDPTFTLAFHQLGISHLFSRNRRQAIVALEKAFSLDPGNIEIRKDLDRARNMSDAEIATYRLSNAAAKTTAAGIKTWNILKLIWIFGLPLAIILIVAQFAGSMSSAVGYILAFFLASAAYAAFRRLKDWFDNF